MSLNKLIRDNAIDAKKKEGGYSSNKKKKLSTLLEKSPEVVALVALHGDSDGSAFRPTVLLKIIQSILDTMLTLLLRSATADPGEDLIARIDEEDILGVELVTSGSSALGNLGHLHRARGVAETEEDTRACSTLKLEVITTLGGSGIGALAETLDPLLGPFLGLGELVKDDDLRDAATLIIKGTADLSGPVTLKDPRILAIELDEEKAKIKDEHITAVDRLGIESDLHRRTRLRPLTCSRRGLYSLGLTLLKPVSTPPFMMRIPLGK